MNYKYKNINYDIEYAVIGEEDFDIWLQNPDDTSDYVLFEDMPEHIQDELYSMVVYDAEDSDLADDHNEMECCI